MSFFTTTSSPISSSTSSSSTHPHQNPSLSIPTGARTCLLCTSPLPYPPNTPIGVLNSPYASSLCRLLSLPEPENSPLFQHGLYCSNCFQVINDIHHKLNNLLTLWASVNVTRNFVKQMILSQQQQQQQQQQSHREINNHIGLARVKIANSLQHQRWREQQQQHQQHQQQHEFVLDEIASFLTPSHPPQTQNEGSTSSSTSNTTTYELQQLDQSHHQHQQHSQHVTCYNLTTTTSSSTPIIGTTEHILGLPSAHSGVGNVVAPKGQAQRGGRGKGKKNTGAAGTGGRKKGGSNSATATNPPPPPQPPKKPKGPPKQVAKKFKCHLCGEEFYQRSSLAIHDRLHTQRTSLLHTCRHCGANLTNKLQIDLHNCIQMRELPTTRLPREHPPPTTTPANLHPSSPTADPANLPESQEILEAHKLNTNEALGISSTDTVCFVCGKDLRSPAKLKGHLVMTHNLGAKPYKCLECGQEFLYSKTLTSHLKGHSGRGRRGKGRKSKTNSQLLKCEVCDKGFKTKAAKMRHFKSHQISRTTPCPHCTKEFKSKDKLARHVELHRPKGGSLVKLSSSNQQFLVDSSGEVETLDVKPVILGDGSLGVESTSTSSNHRNPKGTSHKKPKKLIPYHPFKNFRKRMAQVQSFHQKNNGTAILPQKLYLCFICNEEFSEKLYLKRHMLKHNSSSSTVGMEKEILTTNISHKEIEEDEVELEEEEDII